MHKTLPPCPGNPACRCDDPSLAQLARAIEDDDLDRAIDLGLLSFAADTAACETCAPRIAAVLAARDGRLRALAARERYRARQMRLADRAQARARRRPPVTVASTAPTASPPAKSTLPPAAAAALARAKAKAAAKRGD